MNDRQFNGLLAQLEAIRQEQRAATLVEVNAKDVNAGDVWHALKAADALASTAQTTATVRPRSSLACTHRNPCGECYPEEVKS